MINSIPHLLAAALFSAFLEMGCYSDEHHVPEVHTMQMQPLAKYSEVGPAFSMPGPVGAPDVGSFGAPVAKHERPRPGHPRMVIMNAELELEVKNFDGAMSELKSITRRSAGFIVLSTTNGGSRERNRRVCGEATLRIPTAVFGQTLASIESIATKVERETVRGNDVTDEYYDVAARLINKQAAEAQYLHVFERAKSVKDILQVEEAISGVRQEIEELMGRKKYLADQVDLSTIEVKLHEPPPPAVAASFGSKIAWGVQRGIDGLTDGTSTLAMITISGGPYLALLFLGGYLFVRIYRSRQSRA